MLTNSRHKLSGGTLLQQAFPGQIPLQSVENKPRPSRCSGARGPGRSSPVMDACLPSLRNINTDSTNNNLGPMKKVQLEVRQDTFSSQYTVESEIGRGKFAVVKKCRHKSNGMAYAAKFLRKRRKGKDCRQEILHEVRMLEMALLHPRLVDLVEVYETTHEFILVTEYAWGGEIFQQIIVQENLEEKEAKRLIRQILEGLVFLHDNNVVHLDIKPQNILLTKDYPHGNVKICDFGFARHVCSGEDVRDIIGTPDYVAPEVLSYEPINTASDMWSIGVLTYVMVTGCSPFAGDTKAETFLNISQVNLDFPEELFGDISLDAVDFMTKVMVRQPEERLTARECLNHPWLRVQSEVPQSPFGSPLGQRRALTPPSPETEAELEPLRKCKCDDLRGMDPESETEITDNNSCSSTEKKRDSDEKIGLLETSAEEEESGQCTSCQSEEKENVSKDLDSDKTDNNSQLEDHNEGSVLLHLGQGQREDVEECTKCESSVHIEKLSSRGVETLDKCSFEETSHNMSSHNEEQLVY